MGLLVADAPMACAGVFTQNHFAAAPVLLCKAHLQKSGGRVRALVVNSGNANACTGAQGERDAAETAARVAKAVGCPVEQVLVCSTGVIGQPLPMKKLRAGVDAALAARGDHDHRRLPEGGQRAGRRGEASRSIATKASMVAISPEQLAAVHVSS